jgi:programmed cell death 6-interacting protein
MFRHDLDVIDALRRDAVNSRDAHPTGIKKLHTYAGQLVWMSGKFPIDVWTP